MRESNLNMMIKKISVVGFVIAIAGGTFSVTAQPIATDETPRENLSAQNLHYHLGTLEKVNKVIGTEVRDANNQKLGKIKDLAIDLQNGRIVEVIVATGGVLGIDEQLIAVPPQEFSRNPAGKDFQLNLDHAQFAAAPRFKMSEWESNVHEANVAEVYRYYSERPYFNAEANGSHITPANHVDKTEHATGATDSDQVVAAPPAIYPMPARMGDVQRASKLLDATTRNPQNEKLGKLENLVVDLPAGRVVEVIVASGGFLGLGDSLSAVPPQSFHPGIYPDTLTLDTTRQIFSSAPHFKPDQWQVSDPQQVEAVYHAYHVEPYFETAADNTAQNVRDRDAGALTPLSQGTSPADVKLTRDIRKRIIGTHGLSADARNVKVITRDGHVTLRGPVNSEDEKHHIGDIAAKAASPANVDNQLEVANTSPTSSVK
jgi:sporulation protein YlmC with PRC-barrel domain